MLSKICIFDIGNNVSSFNIGERLLWIAFKNLYLWHRKQPIRPVILPSKVVNCFQKFVSLTSETTLDYWACKCIKLWIAFKNLYLWHRKQLRLLGYRILRCCELLSKICIFDIGNNTLGIANVLAELWIAFKNLYLWHRKQLNGLLVKTYQCCELLSKICIFDIGNNVIEPPRLSWVVVNCFQKFVSLTSETTSIVYYWHMFKLWIAFKNLYLWHRKQLRGIVK